MLVGHLLILCCYVLLSSALEILKFDLDPEDKDRLVSSETFCEIMNDWTKKIANTGEDTEEFNQSVK